MTIGDIIFIMLFVVPLVGCLIGWILIAVVSYHTKIKCRNVQFCMNDNCRYREWCKCAVMTDKEYEEFMKELMSEDTSVAKEHTLG